jgi:hypothetical protein
LVFADYWKASVGVATLDDVTSFASQSHRAAAVMCRTQYGNLHAGIVHRTGDGEVEFLHLGWQDTLSKEWTWCTLWAAPDVESERLVSVAGMCRLVWARFLASQTFPYALRFSGTTFSVTGQLVLGEGAQGLTCATFVLAVFKSVGVSLVDESDWPVRPEDDRRFLETVRSFAAPNHFALLQAEVNNGVVRIRPEEVIGACSQQLPARVHRRQKVLDPFLFFLTKFARRAVFSSFLRLSSFAPIV